MSTEHYDVLVIGFVVEIEDILRPFTVTVAEKAHYEDRYDPKTGNKTHLVRVVDAEETTEYVVDKKRFNDQDEVFNYLCKKTGAMWTAINDDGDGNGVLAIEPKCTKKDEVKLEAKFMARVCEDCSQIRTLFKKNWGIDLGDAKIQTCETWG